MIEDRVTQLAGLYVGYWNTELKDHPRYTLDSSWPSVGTVQLTLAHLFGKTPLSEADLNLISGAAAYLGSMAHQNWLTFAEEMNVSLTMTEAPDRGIVLTVKSGPGLSRGESFSVNILAALLQFLAAPQKPFPTYERFVQQLYPEEFALPGFVLGLMSGLCPHGVGPWKDLVDSEAKVNVYATDVVLAKSCAAFYAKSFPTDPGGTDPVLYSRGGILPPAGFREKFFSARAAYALSQHLAAAGRSRETMLATALNLAVSPNPNLAVSGFALAVALTQDQTPSRRLLAISEGIGTVKLLLKGAIALTRNVLGLPESMSTLLKQNKIDEAERLLHTETQLGLHPFFRIPLRDTLEIPLLSNHLYWMLARESRQLIDTYAAANELSPGLALQAATIDVSLGEFAAANSRLAAFEAKWPDQMLGNGLLAALRDELRGTAAISGGDIPRAESMFARALGCAELDPLTRAQLMAMHAECLNFLGRASDSILEMKKAIELHPLLQASINVLRIEQSVQPKEDFAEQLNRLITSAPRNLQLFALIRQARAVPG